MRQLGEIYNPSWSPDGKQIVFSAMRGGASDLYVYNVAEGLLTQLTATGLKPHFLEKLAANNVVLPPSFFNPEEVDVRAAFSVNGYGVTE